MGVKRPPMCGGLITYEGYGGGDVVKYGFVFSSPFLLSKITEMDKL